MGIADHEVTEEEMEKSNEKKLEAIELVSEGKFEEAINAYTEAILLNPSKLKRFEKTKIKITLSFFCFKQARPCCMPNEGSVT